MHVTAFITNSVNNSIPGYCTSALRKDMGNLSLKLGSYTNCRD